MAEWTPRRVWMLSFGIVGCFLMAVSATRLPSLSTWDDFAMLLAVVYVIAFLLIVQATLSTLVGHATNGIVCIAMIVLGIPLLWFSVYQLEMGFAVAGTVSVVLGLVMFPWGPRASRRAQPTE